jgi:hypothetical protein
MRPDTPGGGGDPAPEGGGAADPGPGSSRAAPGTPRSTHGARPRTRQWRYRLALAGLLVALAGLAGSVAAVVLNVLPRTFSPAQQQKITAWEVGKRWRTWPAGRIFPSAIPYELSPSALDSPSGVRLSARRIGIAPPASCTSSADRAASRVLARQGCEAMLRATYQDATGAFAVTIGIAVLPSPDQASDSVHALPQGISATPSVHAVGFRHTLAAGFTDPARQLSQAISAGPYLIMSTVGYADGRHKVREAADPYDKDEMLSLASGISDWIGSRIGASPPPPRCPGGPAC